MSMREHHTTLISLGPRNPTFSQHVGHLVRAGGGGLGDPTGTDVHYGTLLKSVESGPAAAIKHCLGPLKVPQCLGGFLDYVSLFVPS